MINYHIHYIHNYMFLIFLHIRHIHICLHTSLSLSIYTFPSLYSISISIYIFYFWFSFLFLSLYIYISVFYIFLHIYRTWSTLYTCPPGYLRALGGWADTGPRTRWNTGHGLPRGGHRPPRVPARAPRPLPTSHIVNVIWLSHDCHVIICYMMLYDYIFDVIWLSYDHIMT